MDFTNGFKIIGIAIQTSNQNNQSQYDLGKLWGKFYSENIIEKVPNKISSEILSIYTDYKSNFTEEYTVIIGVPVSSLNEIPEGLTGREFDKENFQKFIAKGEMPNAVVNTWKEIWEKEKELNRKYTYDFEVYGAKSQNAENSEVEMYIALK